MPQTLLGPKHYEEEMSDEQHRVSQISFQINFDSFGKEMRQLSGLLETRFPVKSILAAKLWLALFIVS